MNDLKGRIRHTREFEIKKYEFLTKNCNVNKKNGFEPSNQRIEI